MSDDLLSYYNRELSYLRRMGADYAKKYPKIAGRLKLDDDSVEDPHVSRLLEGVSLLTAQIRQKLDDSFPELTDALLGQLAPDYQVTIPSLGICQLNVNEIVSNGSLFEQGSRVVTHVAGYKPCEFTTCYDTDVKPLKIEDIRFKNAPFNAPASPWVTKPQSVLQFSLKHVVAGESLSMVNPDKLRFYLGGQMQHAFLLYTHLFQHLIGISISAKDDFGHSKTLETRHLSTVGFEHNESVLPYGKKSFDGYRLLVEQFVFPQKFLFVELVDLLSKLTPEFNDEVQFHFYFSAPSPELESNINQDSLKLNCTPIINCFEQQLEPVTLSPSVYEYRIVADNRDESCSEVIAITDVALYDSEMEKTSLGPFYSQSHPSYQDVSHFWVARREHSDWSGGVAQKGTELFVSVVDRDFNSFTDVAEYSSSRRLSLNGRCSNRNLPVQLPYGGGNPVLHTPTGGHMVQSATCMTPFTSAVRPELGKATRWQLLRLVSLEHFSGSEARDKLCDLLHLFNFADNAASNTQIQHIDALTISPATAKLQVQGRMGVCYGSDINLTLNPAGFPDNDLFFFATVLDRFFALFAAINSFTRLKVTCHGRTQLYHQWPARIGERALL
ncbi:MAG: type VI secretion system protein ImpG [Moritella dasanensis]|jgi:type VI secretion system protein ImpG